LIIARPQISASRQARISFSIYRVRSRCLRPFRPFSITSCQREWCEGASLQVPHAVGPSPNDLHRRAEGFVLVRTVEL